MGSRSKKPAAAAEVKSAPSKAEQIKQRQDRELLKAAIDKSNKGQTLTRKELAAVASYEAEQRRFAGESFVRAVPKKLYGEWSGRQTKILHDQADLYGLPLRGETIDLVALVARLHEWLAEHKHELAIVAKGEASASSGGGRGDLVAAQAENVRKKNQLLDATIEKKAGELIPRETCHLLLGRLAKILQKSGHTLHKIDPRAGNVLNLALERFQELIDQFADGSLALEDDHAGEGSSGVEPKAA